MKKVVGFSVALAAVLFAACDNKENSYNFAQIIYPSGYGSVLYADQTVDSLRFATTYDWSLSVSEGWIHVDADSMSGTVPQGYFMVKRLDVDLDVNNTDTVRTGYIYFHADGKTLVTSYTQYHYLNIERPVRRNYQFTLQDTARQVRDSLIFQTYGDDWTLAFKGEAPAWVRLADGAATSGRAGKYTVHYQLDQNTTTAEKLYDPRLLRGLVLQNRVDEPFGLRNVKRSLYHRVCGGVQLVLVFDSQQGSGVAFRQLGRDYLLAHLLRQAQKAQLI